MTLVNLLQWTASASGIIAAVIVAANVSTKISGVGFVIFTLSSVLWISTAILGDRNPLLLQNVVLFGVNLFGLYRYLLKPPRRAPD